MSPVLLLSLAGALAVLVAAAVVRSVAVTRLQEALAGQLQEIHSTLHRSPA